MITQNIRNLVAQIIAECDAIDAQGGQNPPPPSLPPALDCLAGTVPPATSMYSDELNETAWLNKRATYRTTMKSAPSGSIMFIGDSMIERGDFSTISPYAVNLGISGESSRQLQYRINETDINNQPNLIHRAGAVVILTGVNDLSDFRNGTPNNAADTVKIILDRIINWTSGRVVICKVIPVDSAVFSVPTNESIQRLNGYISAYSTKPWVKVVDVNATLAPQGSLLPQYHVDGQHLSTAGYDVLKSAIFAKLGEFGL